MARTTRMTTAQAIVKFLDNQYVSMDGRETKFVEGFFTLFGHGIAVGLGEALDTNPGGLRVLQGRNEQGMCHTATAFAKQSNRRKIIPCASSIGPGAANMVTACATATVNNIPPAGVPGRHLRLQTAGSGSSAAGAGQQSGSDDKRCVQAGLQVLGQDHQAGDGHDGAHQCHAGSDRSRGDRRMLYRPVPGCGGGVL